MYISRARRSTLRCCKMPQGEVREAPMRNMGEDICTKTNNLLPDYRSRKSSEQRAMNREPEALPEHRK